MQTTSSSRRWQFGIPLLSLLSGTLPAGASAAEDLQLEEVIVTATKDAREASKVPISISAYNQEMMDERRIRDIGDIVAQTPGLNLGDQGSNGAGDRISIRGIDSNSGASTTGVYIDDMPVQSRSNPVNLAGTVFPEVFDLERVEVLRGPQGTLFGAGAEGGVVRFITPTPSLNKSSVYARAETSFTAHGDPSYEAGAAYGAPLIDGVLGLRISAWGRHTGGWVDRVSWQTGERFAKANWSDAGGARIAMLWQASDAWQVMPSLMYQGSHDNDTPNYWAADSQPNQGRFVNRYAARQQSTEHFALPALKVEGDLGAMQFTSVTSFFHRTETNVSDVTNFDIAGALGALGANGEDNIFPTVASGAPVLDLFLGATRQNVFTQEFRLQSTDKNARLRWVAGVYFQNSRLNDSQDAPNPLLPTLFEEQQGPDAFSDYYYDLLTCAANCAGLLDGYSEYRGHEYSQDKQVALFGNVEWSATDRIVLSGGVRVERSKSTFVAVENGPVNNGYSTGGGQADESPITPKVSISFQQDNDHLYYGSIAKGYRPGGGNSHVPQSCGNDLDDIGVAEAPKSYDSDYTWSYEAGTKQRYGWLSVDASAYFIHWRNVQWYYFLPNCGYGIVFNLGHVISKGVDMELNARFTDQLQGTLAVGYNDATFQDTVSKGGAPVVFAGQSLGQARWTIYASLEYQLAIAGRDGFYARVSDNYKGGGFGKALYQYEESAVYDETLRPGSSINQLDLRFGRRWNSLDVSAFITNALDAAPRIVNPQSSHYVGYDFNSEDTVHSPIYAYSSIRPRTIGLTATLKF